jgi:hypothetical protein
LLLLLDDRLLPLGSLSEKHPLRRQVNHLSLDHGVNKRSGVHQAPPCSASAFIPIHGPVRLTKSPPPLPTRTEESRSRLNQILPAPPLGSPPNPPKKGRARDGLKPRAKGKTPGPIRTGGKVESSVSVSRAD